MQVSDLKQFYDGIRRRFPIVFFTMNITFEGNYIYLTVKASLPRTRKREEIQLVENTYILGEVNLFDKYEYLCEAIEKGLEMYSER